MGSACCWAQLAEGMQHWVAGADAPREVAKSSAAGAWSPAVEAARQPSRDLPVEAAANGSSRGHTTFLHYVFYVS